MMIQLDNGEVAIAQCLAALRECVNMAAGVKEKRRDSSALDISMLGMLAEIAWAKWQNTYPDLTVYPRAGGHDAITTRGRRVDIKATVYKNGRLLAIASKTIEDADVYVLAIIHAPHLIEFVGYANAAELITQENLVDLGHGPVYALNQDRLRRFKEDT